MTTPQKHATLIRAWADGAEIEFQRTNDIWAATNPPAWSNDVEYRIKPEPKPDVTRYVNTYQISGHETKAKAVEGACGGSRGIMRVTFDGETGNLKSAEVA